MGTQETLSQRGEIRTDTGEAAALLEPILVPSPNGKMPDRLDTVTEQIRAHVLLPESYNDQPGRGLQGLVAFWATTMGVDWLWTLGRAAHVYGLGSWQSGAGSGRLFSGEDTQQSSPNRGLGILDFPAVRRALRRYFFALPEARFVDESARFLGAREATRAPVEPRWADDGDERAFAAWILGRNGDHAKALFSRDAAGNIEYIARSGTMLACFTDLDIARQFIESRNGALAIEGADNALDLVETFGGDAAPLLERILSSRERLKPKLHPYCARRFRAAIELAKTDPGFKA